MTIESLLIAINECNNGDLNFNLGETRSFLFHKKWYPLRATVNRARELSNETPDLTPDRALVELVFLNLWVRVQVIRFNHHLPIEATSDQTSNEVKSLSEILYNLTKG